jgi:cysteinyl-tRNA synthetase
MEQDGAAHGQGEWKEAIEPQRRISEAREAFWAAMGDDLNTPEALAALFTAITDLNAQDDRVTLTREERDAALAFLDETDAIFACWPHEELQADAGVTALIERRRAAKAAKDWIEADRVRDELKAMGIVLEDRKDGTVTWRRA